MRTDRALRVPFNRASAGEEERRYIAEVLDSGHLAGNGAMPYTGTFTTRSCA